MVNSFVYDPRWIGFVLANFALATGLCIYWVQAESKPKGIPTWVRVTLSIYILFVMWLVVGTMADWLVPSPS